MEATRGSGVIVAIDGVATGRHDLHRLERLAVHDRVLGRPVGATDQVLVLVALELGGIDRTGIRTQAHGGDRGGLFVEHVDDGGQAVTTDGVNVAARSRQAGDVHRVAGIEDLPDLVGVAVDQRELARVAQRDREHVLQVDLVHLLGRTVLDGDQQLPAVLHVLERELGRDRRRVLDVTRHQVDLFLGQDVIVVDHAAFGAVRDDLLEALGAELEGAALQLGAVRSGLGPVRLEVLAGGALAQHAVATCAALEVDLLAFFHLLGGQLGRFLGPGAAHREGQHPHGKRRSDQTFLLHSPLLTRHGM